MTSADRRRTDWRDELMRGVTNRYGPQRAIADDAHIDHLATMIELLEYWEPSTYPTFANPGPVETLDDGPDNA